MIATKKKGSYGQTDDIRELEFYKIQIRQYIHSVSHVNSVVVFQTSLGRYISSVTIQRASFPEKFSHSGTPPNIVSGFSNKQPTTASTSLMELASSDTVAVAKHYGSRANQGKVISYRCTCSFDSFI